MLETHESQKLSVSADLQLSHQLFDNPLRLQTTLFLNSPRDPMSMIYTRFECPMDLTLSLNAEPFFRTTVPSTIRKHHTDYLHLKSSVIEKVAGF